MSSGGFEKTTWSSHDLDQDLKYTKLIAEAAAVFAFPLVIIGQLIITRKPSVAMVAGGVTWYNLYDGTATGLLYSYLATGVVVAYLSRNALSDEFSNLEKVAKGYGNHEKQVEIQKYCKKHPILARAIGLDCSK